MFLDSRAHKTIYDGCSIARAHGAAIERFRHNDPEHLEELLRASTVPPKIIAMDGVNSMTGNPPDIARVRSSSPASTTRCSTWTTRTASASSASAVADELCDYGTKGNSIIRHQGETYDNVILRRRLLQGLLVAARVPRAADAAEGRAEGRWRPPTCTRVPRRSPRSQRRSPGSR